MGSLSTAPHPLRILLLGDYSNCHRSLATGLRRLGHSVTLVSDGAKWLDCERDIDFTRPPCKAGGARLLWRMLFGDLSHVLAGNDIVAIHDINFAPFSPRVLRPLFHRLKRQNRSVFLTSMSTDIAYLDMLEPPGSPLRYSEWFYGDAPSRLLESDPAQWQRWHSPALVDYQREVLKKIDGAVSVLYEYQLGMERAIGADRAAYGGIPIDTRAFTPVELPARIDKVKLFLGRDRTRKLVKGSDYLEIAAKRVVERHPDKAELTIVENRPYAEFVELLRGAHIVLDQIYSYTPATTALLAMAYGLNVVSGGESDYYDFIGEQSNRPVINAPTDLDALTDAIENAVLHPKLIAERGRRSREFVVKHNDAEIVARRFLDFWLNKM